MKDERVAPWPTQLHMNEGPLPSGGNQELERGHWAPLSQGGEFDCAIVMTVHNRAETTRRFFASLVGTGFNGSVYVCDDGSTDNTAQVLVDHYPFNVHIIHGSGKLYWSGGMRIALAEARGAGHDPIVLANDDIELMAVTFSSFLDELRRRPVVIGQIADKAGHTLYGGLDRPRPVGRPFTFRQVERGKYAETFNANCVGLREYALRLVEPFPSPLIHAGGDIDLGLQLSEAGVPLYVYQDPVAYGAANRIREVDTESKSLRSRLRAMHSPLRWPYKQQHYLHRRHGGIMWPLCDAAPYVRLLAQHLRSSISTKRRRS